MRNEEVSRRVKEERVKNDRKGGRKRKQLLDDLNTAI
jgi:hypothetical protein